MFNLRLQSITTQGSCTFFYTFQYSFQGHLNFFVFLVQLSTLQSFSIILSKLFPFVNSSSVAHGKSPFNSTVTNRYKEWNNYGKLTTSASEKKKNIKKTMKVLIFLTVAVEKWGKKFFSL